ncbi:MAG: ATP-binding protein [Bacteroides sp.]
MISLQRKIDNILSEWKANRNKKPLVIKGCRQCGKTYSVRSFATRNYNNVIYINFMENDEYHLAFEKSRRIDDIILNITTIMEESVKFEAGNTCLILDEIQECPEARASLKFFKLDGRFDVIATGSLLGVKGYGHSKASIPVGYETIVNMYPLDFEEFLWANGISTTVVDKLRECIETMTPVPEAIHNRMRQMLLYYTIVGGMPEVVQSFVSTKNMQIILDIQRNIIDQYEDDMLKYADDSDKPRIRECFESIPKQLAKENKKFQYSLVRKGGKAAQFAGSLQWIEDAGIICRCHNLNITELPLDGNAVNDVFKVYMVDTGLFVSMLEDGTQLDILRGNLFGYKGAIFENLIADIFTKMKRKLYYFRKDSGLEVDFVIRYNGECTLIEVKASSGNVKSTKTILAHPEKYHVHRAIKLGDVNVGQNGQITILPLYMAFLLTT